MLTVFTFRDHFKVKGYVFIPFCISLMSNPRVAMNFAINRKLKLPIDMETIISLLFTLNQY